MQTRIKLLGLLIVLSTLVTVGRLFYWQILEGSDLASEAKAQHQVEKTLRASRGNILASDKTWLAASSDAWLLFISKPELKASLKSVANKLGPLLVDDPENKEELLKEVIRIEELLSKKDIIWVPIAHKLSSDIKQNVEALDIDGVGFEIEEARYYPEASSSAHLLGFVGKDESGADTGYFGLEGWYDLTLKGRHGFKEQESDAVGVPIFSSTSREILAVGGIDLITTIDKTIQNTIEKKLKEGLEKYGAKEGSVVVLDPKDGAVLAMASLPSYDPLNYSEYGDEFFRNPVISDSFEPGSVFKVMVMAAALDSGAVEIDMVCECNGPYKIDKYSIETWNNEYFPDSSMTDIIVNSDNVGMIFVAEKLGSDLLFEYLNDYGFGQLTGVDLQGEATPTLRKRDDWSDVDLAVASFGQGIAVTPLQMTSAVGVIANKGQMVKPRVVDKIAKSGWESDIAPEFGQRVISEKAAEEITNMMVSSVKHAEYKWPKAKGFLIAGKTGTAQVPISGHYDDSATIASFVGFAPADKPKFVMLTTLKEPTSSPWASGTAAPLWFSIASELFPYLGIHPEN